MDAVGPNTGTVRGDAGFLAPGGRADVAVRSATASFEAKGGAGGSARGSARPVEAIGVVVAELGRVAGFEVRGYSYIKCADADWFKIVASRLLIEALGLVLIRKALD